MKIEHKHISHAEGARHGIRAVDLDLIRISVGDRVETNPHRGTFGTFQGITKGGTIVVEWERPSNEVLEAHQDLMRAIGIMQTKVTSSFAHSEPAQIKRVAEVICWLTDIASNGDIGLANNVAGAKSVLDQVLADAEADAEARS